MERLCVLASKYKYLRDFIKKYKFKTSNDESKDFFFIYCVTNLFKYYFLKGLIAMLFFFPDLEEICGLYLQSFCCGLEVVLNVYQEDLVQIEKEILKDPFLPLTHFLKLEKVCFF